jgi:sulfopyruvate decarboxylase TPP-binding subunit
MEVLDFWDTLCNVCGYRFFTGVPNNLLSNLYNSLNSDILHFVPAVNDTVAINMAAGVSMVGDRAAILCSAVTFAIGNYQINNLIIKKNIPVLLIVPAGITTPGVKVFYEDQVADVCRYIEEEQKPAALAYNNI